MDPTALVNYELFTSKIKIPKRPSALSVGGLVSPSSSIPPGAWVPEGRAQDLNCSYDVSLLN